VLHYLQNLVWSKAKTAKFSFVQYYSMTTIISWMEVLIVRWEIVVTLHLTPHQVNPTLVEAASAAVVVAAPRSSTQLSDCSKCKKENHHTVLIFCHNSEKCGLLIFLIKNQEHLMFLFICSISLVVCSIKHVMYLTMLYILSCNKIKCGFLLIIQLVPFMC
jgi:hypothetical protein